jgi:hypothetical protein
MRPLRRSIAVSALVLLAAACASSSARKADDLRAVDDLVGRVERVYVEAELSRERITEAIDALELLAAPDFAGDPVEAYTTFVVSVEGSQQQAEAFGQSIDAMDAVARKVFAQWEKDLEAFQSPDLRRRSQARLAAARNRYTTIKSTVDPVRESFETFNVGLGDHAIYLGHDYNREALAEIAPETAGLGEQAKALERALQTCMDTALAYVQASALPGQIEQPVQASESAARGDR